MNGVQENKKCGFIQLEMSIQGLLWNARGLVLALDVIKDILLPNGKLLTSSTE